MSRTDVHRPAWVQLRDPTIRHWFKDVHNHEQGICDLQHWLDTTTGGWWYHKHFYCYRQPWMQAPRLCGCEMCAGQRWRRLQRKQERVAWRRVRQQLVKLKDWEDVDVPPLHGSAWE
jgi:hypothetical protein